MGWSLGPAKGGTSFGNRSNKKLSMPLDSFSPNRRY
jgi:hypothetical protein